MKSKILRWLLALAFSGMLLFCRPATLRPAHSPEIQIQKIEDTMTVNGKEARSSAARVMGEARSERKTAAARKNAKLGGRPRELFADLIPSPRGKGSCDHPGCKNAERYLVYSKRTGLVRRFCAAHTSPSARRNANDLTCRGVSPQSNAPVPRCPWV